MWQRVDLNIALDLRNRLGAGERVGAVDVHRTRTAYAFSARAAEGQRGVDFILDLDDRVQHHRAAVIEVYFETIDGRIGLVIWTPAVDTKYLDIFGASGGFEGLAFANAGILG